MLEGTYHQWHKSQEELALRTVQFVNIESRLHVANMIGQRGIYRDGKGPPPIRYDAVRQCLKGAVLFAVDRKASAHIPRIDCGLTGGKWELMEQTIKGRLIIKEIAVTVYDL